MTVEELMERLESIEGYGPIENARRIAIIAAICRLTSQGEK